MGDEADAEIEEEPATPLTAEVAAKGLSRIVGNDQLGFSYTQLSLRGAKLMDLAALPTFTGLELVDVGQNAIIDIDPLRKVETLLSVKLDQNQISSIDCLPSMPNLQVCAAVLSLTWQLLNVATNQLASLAACVQPMLMYLNLDSNQLETLDLSGCPMLKTLSVRSNKLTDTTGLKNLANLESLHLSANAITTLELGTLPQLTDLDASTNQITSLDCLTGFPCLQSLKLAENQVPVVEELDNAAGLPLQTMVLTGNPVTEVGQYRNFVHAAAPGLLSLDGEPYAEEDLEPPPPPPEPEPAAEE
eukprot:TRINITY_DN7006_c0_g1_i2.p1 TRINITY_DN7006_c0_g1~~TRINITY_DN7006_c0_g1_i2.p1  ORF type:complete len:303 (-),score=91.16 TRINITY_DN7006_c0_g1_i2:248-1156(-)